MSQAAAGAAQPGADGVHRTGFTVAADGSYAACLAERPAAVGGPGPDAEPDGPCGPYVERWSLDGPEPYTVALPEALPEESGTQVLPLPDGRVLVARPHAHGGATADPGKTTGSPGPTDPGNAVNGVSGPNAADIVLLYPSGAGTGSQTVGAPAGREVRLLPASAAGAFATSYDGAGTEVWRVWRPGGGAPVRLARVPGRCTGGVWLDRDGRLLALDRELEGRTKAVAVDLGCGVVSPLLQLAEDSNDRLLLAEPDSGLMLVRSDATGEDRLGWGVLGSRTPVRFPEALRLPGALLTPVAAQPGQILTPEAAVVALSCEVPGGGRSLALWRPGSRTLHWRAVPQQWLGPVGLWLPGGPLRLPAAPPALVPYDVPAPEVPALPAAPARAGKAPAAGEGPALVPAAPVAPPALGRRPSRPALPGGRKPAVLPLQQAPLSPVA